MADSTGTDTAAPTETSAATTRVTSPRVSKRDPHALRWGAFVPIGLTVLVAVIGPFVTPHDPVDIVGPPATAPNGEFWFGLDANGMDVFSRVIAATRTNLLIAAAATAIATLGGILLGLVGGVGESGGRGLPTFLARGLARGLDILDAIPSVIIGLVLVALIGPSTATIIAGLAIVSLPRQAKLVRAEVLKTRGEAFVDAARQAGDSRLTIMFRTILPNSIGTALENMSAVFGLSIIVAAALGFLGVGLPPPAPEWGTMIATGSADALNLRWWAATFPTLALILTVASVALASAEILRRRH